MESAVQTTTDQTSRWNIFLDCLGRFSLNVCSFWGTGTLNFVLGRAKMAVYMSRKNRIEKAADDDARVCKDV